MTEIYRPHGLKIIVPESYQVVEMPAEPPPTSTRRAGGSDRGRRFGPVPMPDRSGAAGETASLVDALQKQEMELVDAFGLEPKQEPTPASGRRRRGAAAVPDRQSATLEIELPSGEDAVLLVEQDGVFSWVFPNPHTIVPTPAIRRSARATPPPHRVTFTIEIHASSTAKRRRDRRGLFTDLIYSRVKAFVLKFVARIAVGQTMKFFERNVSRGIVVIDSEDPQRWHRVADITEVSLPQDRAPRVLLLVHGTFSSTTGSFGALGSTPWGHAFLAGALATYDAVIGFDHPTLSEDPLVNAVDLLERLQQRQWPHPPQLDAVAFSRGALVLRTLIEQLLPEAKWPAHFEKVIFVGCTNGGTALAEPDNWHALVDLYTNLATGLTKLLGLLPQAAAPMMILTEMLQGLGALVKYIATEAVTSGGAPGLAAMEPNGDFVTQINQTQQGQPTSEKSCYYAITSQFRAQVLKGSHEPKDLPRRLVLALADGFIDQLMNNAPNDLVVDTTSMTQIDVQSGQYVRETFDFGITPHVHHLSYFVRPEVSNALTRWLQLAAPVVGGETTSRSSGQAIVTTKPSSVKAISVTVQESAGVPLIVDKNILVADVTTPVGELLADISAQSPGCIVLRRSYQGEILNYAMQTENLLKQLGSSGSEVPLLHALDLRENQQTKTRSVTTFLSPVTISIEGEVEVVLSGNEPVGVLNHQIRLPGNIVDIARRTMSPKTSGDFILARRVMPSFTSIHDASLQAAPRIRTDIRATRNSTESAPSFVGDSSVRKKPRSIGFHTLTHKIEATPDELEKTNETKESSRTLAATCHFRAEMEEEVLLNRVTTIEVDVSREIIDGVQHAAATEAASEVDPARKLLIQVIPKRNFESVSEEGPLVIDPPEPQKPKTFYFDVRATHDEDGEGELWVVARQGQVPLVRLTLRPRIVTKRTAAVRRAASADAAAEAQPLAEPLTQLFIYELINGNEIRYRFHLQSPRLGMLAGGTSKPICGDRQGYVAKLYSEIENRWVSNGGDVEDFYQELRAYGTELFKELVPTEVQEALWQHRDAIDSIMVIAEEPFIPWELVHVVEPRQSLRPGTRFFGEMGLVRWLEEAGWPQDKIPLAWGRARFVIPDYPHPAYRLPEAIQEATYLQKAFGASAVDPTSSAVRQLLSSPGAFDLLHFGCHGGAEEDNVAHAALLLEGRLEGGNYIPEYFNATTAEHHSNFQREGHPGPMIVLNACQVGRTSYKLTGTGGFARAFLHRGASVFVGTLWSVGDSPARAFTEEFYTQLKTGKACLADATKVARLKAKNAGDATWLAYVVYGHPHARLTGLDP